jgi:CoA:oxalate CoA-transferase
VFMENWRPGVAKRLGVDYETLSALNPGLVYVSASGFGQTGRYGPKASMENTSAAMGGYGSLSGPAGGLGEKPRTQVIDFASPLPVLQGVLLALLHRRESGRGQWIQCSQLQTLAHIQSVRIAEYMMTGQKPVPMGTAIPYTVPSQAFKTADWYIFVDCRTEADWQALCRTLRLPELAVDARYDSNAKRVAARDELVPQLEQAFVRFGVRQWLRLLAEAGVPCSAINMDLEDLYTDPQVVAGKMIAMRPDDAFGAIRSNDVAWEFSRTPAVYGHVLATELDADRESVLAEIRVPGGVA